MPSMAEYAKSGGYAKDAQAAKNIASMPKSSSSGSSSSKSSSSGSSSSYSTPVAYSPPPVVNMPAAKTPAQLAADNAKMFDFYNNNSASAIRDKEWAAANQKYDPYKTVYSGSDNLGNYNINAANSLSRQNYAGYVPGDDKYNQQYVKNVLQPQDTAILNNFKNMPMSYSQASSSPGMARAASYPGMNASATSSPTGGTGTFTPSYTKNATVDSWDIGRQLSYYAANPQEAQQEIARAQGVGGSAADSWANQLRNAISQGGQQSQPASTARKPFSNSNIPMPTGQARAVSQGNTPNGGITPQQNIPFGQMTTDQIRAEAESKINQQVTDRTRIANQTKSGFQTSYDRLRDNIRDDRVLENVSNQRNLNPFSGSSDYTLGQVERERARTDREQQQDLQTRLASVDIELSDFLNQTPEMQQNIINELTRQERAYGVDVANQTGYFNGQRNIAGQQLDLTAENQNFNQARQTKVDNWNAYMESVGLTGNLGTGAKADWSLLGGTDGAMTIDAKAKYLQIEGTTLNNKLAELQLSDYPQEQKLKIEQLQKQIAEIGKAPYQSAQDIEYDKIKLDTAKEQLNQLTNGKPDKPLNFDEAITALNKSPFVSEESTTDQFGKVTKTGKIKVDKPGMVQAIAGLGIPDDQMDALFNYYGISQDEVKAIEEQLRKK